MICEGCGCSESRPCVDEDSGEPCYWTANGLCSVCAPEAEALSEPIFESRGQLTPPFRRRVMPRQVA